MHEPSDPPPSAKPALPAFEPTLTLYPAVWLLQQPGVAASVGLPEFSPGPARLLLFWLHRCTGRGLEPSGPPVVVSTMREAALHLRVSERTARRYAKLLRDAGAWTPVRLRSPGSAHNIELFLLPEFPTLSQMAKRLEARRELARKQHTASAGASAHPPASALVQGIDLSPLPDLISKLSAIAERLEALRHERCELAKRQRDVARKARARIHRMHKAGLLTDREVFVDLSVPPRYRPQGSGSIETLEFQTAAQKSDIARIEAVEAELTRIRDTRSPAPA